MKPLYIISYTYVMMLYLHFVTLVSYPVITEAEQWDDLVDRPLTQNVLRLGFTEEDVRQEALLLIQSGKKKKLNIFSFTSVIY